METLTKYDIREITWPEKHFIIIREVVAFDKLPEFFTRSYGQIYNVIEKAGLKTKDMPSAIYYSINEEKKETDMAAAVAVEGTVSKIKDLDSVTIPPCKVITTTHYGSYESMQPVYAALEKHLADHNLKRDLIIEEYFSDPEKEKDPAKWKTNIYFVLK